MSTDSLRFERLLALANLQAAEKRLASLQRALETVSDGEYLPEGLGLEPSAETVQLVARLR